MKVKALCSQQYLDGESASPTVRNRQTPDAYTPPPIFLCFQKPREFYHLNLNNLAGTFGPPLGGFANSENWVYIKETAY